MSAEHGPGDGDGVDDKIDQLQFDLKEVEKKDKRKPKHTVNFKGRNDDPPKDGGEGVREPEPRKPGPDKNLGGAALTLPGDF